MVVVDGAVDSATIVVSAAWDGDLFPWWVRDGGVSRILRRSGR